jgi:hypothetical protein
MIINIFYFYFFEKKICIKNGVDDFLLIPSFYDILSFASWLSPLAYFYTAR